jgi:hypothetical protein
MSGVIEGARAARPRGKTSVPWNDIVKGSVGGSAPSASCTRARSQIRSTAYDRCGWWRRCVWVASVGTPAVSKRDQKLPHPEVRPGVEEQADGERHPTSIVLPRRTDHSPAHRNAHEHWRRKDASTSQSRVRNMSAGEAPQRPSCVYKGDSPQIPSRAARPAARAGPTLLRRLCRVKQPNAGSALRRRKAVRATYSKCQPSTARLTIRARSRSLPTSRGPSLKLVVCRSAEVMSLHAVRPVTESQSTDNL